MQRRLYNKFVTDSDVTYLILHNGLRAIIDTADKPLISNYYWRHHHRGYVRTELVVDSHKQRIKLHRLIMQVTDPRIHVDHRNHNPLDCRRQNLRIASPADNARNRSSVIHKGIKKRYTDKYGMRYQARIEYNGNYIHLGTFDSIESAALAYNKAAITLFGEFACLNKL